MNQGIASIWHPIDIAVLVLYFVSMIGIGIAVMKRASKGIDSYFLAGNTAPLVRPRRLQRLRDVRHHGHDVARLQHVRLRAEGHLAPWLWPAFNQVFLMVYLSVWMRRSNVLTGAEWITTRFGEGRGAELVRIIVVVFALVSVVGFIAYDFQGMGKFTDDLPALGPLGQHLRASSSWRSPPSTCCMGGMFSVVLTEVSQFVIMAVCSVDRRGHRHVEGVARDARGASSRPAGATSSSAGGSIWTGWP